MVAFLIQGDRDVQEFDCYNETDVAQRAGQLGLGRVLFYPPDDEEPSFVIYLNGPPASSLRTLVFCRHPVAGIHQNHSFCVTLHRWVNNHGIGRAYSVLTHRRLPPSPNSGSQNSMDGIRAWINDGLDALTVHHVQKSISK